MRLIEALLLITISSSVITIFNTNGDLDNDAGVNFQVLFAQKQIEIANLNKDCNAKYADFNQQISDLKDQLTKLTLALKDASANNKNMSADLDSCKKTNLSIDSLNIQINNLTITNTQLTNKNKQYDSDMQKMTQMLADKAKELDAAKLAAQKNTQQITDLNTTISNNQLTIQNFKIQVDQLNVTITQLNVSKDNESKYKLVIVDLQNQLDKLNKDNSDLYVKYKSQADQIVSLQADVDSKKTLTLTINDLTSQLNDSKAQNDKCSKNITDLNINIQQISIDIKAKITDFNGQIYTLKAQLDKANKDNADLKSANSSFSSAVADLTIKVKSIDTLNLTIVDLNKQIAVYTQDKQSLKDQITKLNATIDTYKNTDYDNKNLLIKIDTLNVQITNLNKNNADCDKRSKNFEAISKKLYSDLQILTDKFDVSSSNGKGSTILIGQSLNADY